MDADDSEGLSGDNMTQEYRLCSKLEGLTPEIIRAWNDEIVGDVFLVKR